jgi:hypothetical protein
MATPVLRLRPGDQLASTVCTTRVVVIRVPAEGQPTIECGGSPMAGDHRLSFRNGNHMVARSIDSASRRVSRVHQLPRQAASPEPPVRHSLRPRLTAIAPSAGEAVQQVGGWLFDQVIQDRCAPACKMLISDSENSILAID